MMRMELQGCVHTCKGIIHLVRTQNFLSVSGGKKCYFFGKFCIRTK